MNSKTPSKFDNSKECLYDEQEVFTIKYAPRTFSQLLSGDIVNVELLKWLSKWKKGEAERDCPVVLITGPPGLGKTTLAHIVARTVGYDPLEINASDERSGDALISRISSIITTSPLFSQNPTCLIIDEIDGALDNANSNNSLISFLVKLIDSVSMAQAVETAEDGEGSERVRSTGKGKTIMAHRPIICICNDVYAPALRPLRFALESSRILHVKRPAATQLASRLKDICDEEGLKPDMRAIVYLCNRLDCDIRSCLNALQFISKRTSLLAMSTIDNDLNAWKDSQASPLVILESIFSSSGGAIASQRRLNRLLEGCDDKERIISACFESYPEAKFFDSASLDRVNTSLDWFSWYDKTISTKTFEQPILLGYATVTLLRAHNLLSNPSATRFQYPHLEYELSMERKRCDAILLSFRGGLSVRDRLDSSEDYVLSYLIPYILESLQPDLSVFQSTNKSLLGIKEKAEVSRIISMLKNYGLSLKQHKGHGESSYSFSLEPYLVLVFN